MQTSVFRKVNFNAAHRLHNPNWSEAENKAIFGLCNNANYHGHNYELIVKITGEINKDTGYVFDLKILKEIISNEILDKFDHRNLNLDTQEFKYLNPTAENMAKVIYDILRLKISTEYQLQITLYETERNYVLYPA